MDDPFRTIDRKVGTLMKIAVEGGRGVKKILNLAYVANMAGIPPVSPL